MFSTKNTFKTHINLWCFVFFLIGICFTFSFLYGREIFKCKGYILDTEVVGHYGDFIGGAIGTFVSIILLYYTFKLQRQDSEENAQVYKQQQLNDLFFHLQNQYSDVLKSLKVQTDDKEELQGREALHYKLIEMYKDFQHSEEENVNRKQAVYLFMNFYSLSRDFSPIYFRTLFRTFKLLETSEASLPELSLCLMKILRSQLSDSELIMLRYNGMTKQGANFVNLINKFNLLKHLPPLELMEYKEWSEEMNLEERGCTNVLLLETKHNIQKVLETSSLIESYSNNPKKYNINVSANEIKTEIKLCLYINRDTVLNSSDLIRGICKLADEKKLSLLLFFMKDCLVMSSFNKLNSYRELKFEQQTEESTKWWIVVKSKRNIPLRMRNTDAWN